MIMKVPRFELPMGKDQLEDFFISNKTVMHGLILTSITYAISNNLNSISVAEFWWDSDGEFELELEKANFTESIYNCLLWFEEQELYEKCAQCKKLINKIK